jgi:hypothetical protein
MKQIVVLIYLHRRNNMGGFVRKVFAPSPPAYTPPAAPVAAPVAARVEPEALAPEALAPEAEVPAAMSESIKKKKKGRYSTLLTGSEGSLGSPDIEKKSLLGN